METSLRTNAIDYKLANYLYRLKQAGEYDHFATEDPELQQQKLQQQIPQATPEELREAYNGIRARIASQKPTIEAENLIKLLFELPKQIATPFSVEINKIGNEDFFGAARELLNRFIQEEPLEIADLTIKLQEQTSVDEKKKVLISFLEPYKSQEDVKNLLDKLTKKEEEKKTEEKKPEDTADTTPWYKNPQNIGTIGGGIVNGILVLFGLTKKDTTWGKIALGLGVIGFGWMGVMHFFKDQIQDFIENLLTQQI